jgi:hypothetical protein
MRFSYDDFLIYREIEKDGNGAGDQFHISHSRFQKNGGEEVHLEFGI